MKDVVDILSKILTQRETMALKNALNAIKRATFSRPKKVGKINIFPAPVQAKINIVKGILI